MTQSSSIYIEGHLCLSWIFSSFSLSFLSRFHRKIMAKAAKQSLACKDGGTQKKHIGYSFSESEMDVARQLIQLSGDSDDNHNHDDDNNMNNSEVKVEQSEGDHAADVCSTNNIRETIEEEEEDDEIFYRRKRRFRSIYHVYKSTKPVIISNAQRRKLAVV